MSCSIKEIPLELTDQSDPFKNEVSTSKMNGTWQQRIKFPKYEWGTTFKKQT